MGTTDAIIAFEPEFCPAFGQTVVHIPEGVAALSEPAFCALKADKIVNDGILGFHTFYDPASGVATFSHRMSTWKILLKHSKHQDFVRNSDLTNTTPQVFYLRSNDPKWDKKLIDWAELKAAGFKCVGSMEALRNEVSALVERHDPLGGNGDG